MGYAVVLVEILDADRVPAWGAFIVEAGCASCGAAGDGLTSRSGLPGRHGHRRVTIQLHRLRFKAAGILAHTTLCVRYRRRAQKPVRDRIAPHVRLPGLVLELTQTLLVASLVNAVL